MPFARRAEHFTVAHLIADGTRSPIISVVFQIKYCRIVPVSPVANSLTKIQPVGKTALVKIHILLTNGLTRQIDQSTGYGFFKLARVTASSRKRVGKEK